MTKRDDSDRSIITDRKNDDLTSANNVQMMHTTKSAMRGGTVERKNASVIDLRYPNRSASVALSKNETLLISTAGDVLSSRCRPEIKSSSNEVQGLLNNGVTAVCCEVDLDDDLSTQMQDSVEICSPWRRSNSRPNIAVEGGLLGGAPSVTHWSQESTSTTETRPQHNLTAKFKSPPIPSVGYDEGSIVPMRKTDAYRSDSTQNGANGSQYSSRDDNKIILQTRNSYSPKQKKKVFFEPRMPPDDYTDNDSSNYGIPTFLPSFAQVKITQISANPLGCHVLLISDAGLLYSYGSNKYGQLGIGVKTTAPIRSPHIVTSLVENGGKAVLCAAGLNHSLVVVATEERRMTNVQSFDTTASPVASDYTMYLHQLYGFGRNDFTKIGLANPKLVIEGDKEEAEAVVLPRRVALRSKAYSSQHGIVALEASSEHSAAIVNQPNGDVELYTWGNAMYGALGLPQPSVSHHSALRLVPVPSFVASLSRTSNLQAQQKSVLWYDEKEYPQHIALGQHSSYVTTSRGRSFAFGSSDTGLLGLGTGKKEVWEPTEICIAEPVRRISAGADHVVALARESGHVYLWGDPKSAGNKSTELFWTPRLLDIRLKSRIDQVYAGSDVTVVVEESGRVHSGGYVSDRLGQGCEESTQPLASLRPMFGGFRLWQPRIRTKRHRRVLKRGSTTAL